jgi:4-hydroxy-3-methylbut-2-en-1-yl diphosphate reductase
MGAYAQTVARTAHLRRPGPPQPPICPRPRFFPARPVAWNVVDVDRVLLAAPRGFCAGVEMAIKALAQMVRVFEPPVYCFHEIVHNAVVVERFRAMGVVFVDDISEVPEGAPVMLSAHGSGPDVVDEANRRGGAMVNAVCPLVRKVHKEVELRAGRGYEIVYVGHEGHEEAAGTMAVAPDKVHRLESVEELEALPDPEAPVAFLAQTTLAVDDWLAIREAAEARWPELWMPERSDLCFATTNRQAALRAIAALCDAVVVIGSHNSSNTLALARTASTWGCPRVLRVNGAEELPDDLGGTVGVIAGASAPEQLVKEVVARLAPRHGVEERRAVDEDEYFPVPPQLRDVTRQLAGALATVAFAPAGDPRAGGGRPAGDRTVGAAEVLAELVP